MVRKKMDPKKQIAKEKLEAALSKLKSATSILLAKAKSDTGAGTYDIRLGENNVIYCSCGDFKHRNPEGGCKHIKRLRRLYKSHEGTVPVLVRQE